MSIGGYNMDTVINLQDDINDSEPEIENIEIIINNNILNHSARMKIDEFNKKFLENLLLLKKQGFDINKKYCYRVAELSELANNHMTINSEEQLNQVLAAIDMCERISDKGFEEKNMDCYTRGIYNLKQLLNKIEIFEQ